MKFEFDDSECDDAEQEAPEAISLEELSRTYVTLVQNQATQAAPPTEDSDDPEDEVESEQPTAIGVVDALRDSLADDPVNAVVAPLSIVEAVLFVGKPNNAGITAPELAGLMRGVDEAEVHKLVAELNESYRVQGRALRIVDNSDGYRLALAPHVEAVRDRFYGRIRNVKLSQAAIDCLALIAYQPGISRTRLDDQRGQSSGGVLSQLVRRELIEIRRETVDGVKMTYYHPTDRLLQLVGMTSIDDLPQVEEFE